MKAVKTMEISFSGRIDVGVLRRAFGAALTPGTLILGGVLGCLALWGLIVLPLGGSVLGGWLPILCLFLLFVGLWAHALFMAPRKTFESNKMLQEPISGRATTAGVFLETERSHADLPWEAFLKARIAKGIVLLYQSNQTYNAFPREFFASDADWHAFLELVRGRVPEKPAKGAKGSDDSFFKLALWMVIFSVVLLAYNFLRR